MMDQKPTHSTKWFLLLIPATTLLLSLLITHYSSSSSALQQRSAFDSQFSHLASQTTQLIQEKLNRYPIILNTTRGFVQTHLGELSTAWPGYFAAADVDYSGNGIIGITYTQYVPQSQLATFIEHSKSRYGEAFYPFPDEANGDRYIITEAAPPEVAERVRGFDIGSELKRRSAALRAKNSSATALSEQLSLLPTAEHSVDYLLLTPVETPDPADHYARIFHGWVTIGFSLSQLINEAIESAEPSLQIQLIDARDGLAPRFDTHPDLAINPARKRHQTHHTLTLSRQEFDLIITPLPDALIAVPQGYYHPTTLAVGVLVSLLATLSVFLLLSGRERALKLANAMTTRSKESHNRFQVLFESSPEAVLLCVDNRIILANHSAIKLLQADSLEQLSGIDAAELASPELKEAATTLLLKMESRDCSSPARIEEPLRRLDGSTFDAEITLSRTQYNGATAIQVMFRDITAIKARQNESRIAKEILEHTGEAVMVTDCDYQISYTNPAFTSLTGYTNEQIRGLPADTLVSDHQQPPSDEGMHSKLLHSGHWSGELINRKRSGEIYIQQTNISAVYNKEGEISHFVWLLSDITEQKRTLDSIRFQAFHDTLTHLPNRAHFDVRAEKALQRAQGGDSGFAILFLDIDNFKPINDTYGHLFGDKLLIAVSELITSTLRPNDMVARVGGDEFIILAEQINQDKEASMLAERIIHCLAGPLTIDNISVNISMSVGIARYERNGDTIEALLAQADAAMYEAKQAGKNRYTFALTALETPG